MEDNQFSQYRRNNRFWLGAFCIIGGGLLLASKMGAPIPDWVFSWEMFPFILGLYLGIRHRFQNVGWLIWIGVGTYFLLDERIPDARLHQYILPVMIILVGVIFILFPRYYKRSSEWRRRRWANNLKEEFGYSSSNISVGADGDDSLFINSVFSGIKRNILSKNFKGGEITCIFGGVELDFMQADIQGTAVLRIEQVFGGIEIRVPANWTVRNEIDGAFHGVDDKRRFQDATDPNKVLVLKGSSVFAGIEIKSY
jgi:hypothetical protein